MKTFPLLGILACTALGSVTARGDGPRSGPPAPQASDKAACLGAVSRGQRLRNTHKLVGAREQLRICAAAQCPAVVQTDCANWLVEVEKALPSVVVTAKNGTGGDRLDVQVSVDGEPLVATLDGQAVPVDPGVHTFRFEGSDGAKLEQQVVVVEGEKNQRVAVVLGAATAASTAPAAATTATAPESSGGEAGRSSIPWKTIGWVAGGTGVVGLGLAATFGAIALSDKSHAGCDASNVCNPGTTGAIKSAALASDVGWIAGGVLLAGGAALVLFTPAGGRDPSAAVRVAPVVTANGAALVAGGSW